jgi:thiamine-phosphate pyrophosphorylase
MANLKTPRRPTPAAVWRLLDANVNRAREGLRVVEDTARFVLGDAPAAKAFRGMRHALDRLVRAHYRTLLAARRVESDSGRANVSAVYEAGIPALLAANLKRAEEALRVLEEYGRLLSPQIVPKVQALRFEVYAWEKRIQTHA